MGAATETEMKEKKARVEDALNATRAAVEEGIVPGGGVALVRAVVADLDKLEGLSVEQTVGVADRAARGRGALPSDRGQRRQGGLDRRAEGKEGKGAFGYNAATDTFEDLIEAGVIDPTKVVRSALQNAASVASLLITTEALVAEKPKPRAARPPAAAAVAAACPACSRNAVSKKRRAVFGPARLLFSGVGRWRRDIRVAGVSGVPVGAVQRLAVRGAVVGGPRRASAGMGMATGRRHVLFGSPGGWWLRC